MFLRTTVLFGHLKGIGGLRNRLAENIRQGGLKIEFSNGVERLYAYRIVLGGIGWLINRYISLKDGYNTFPHPVDAVIGWGSHIDCEIRLNSNSRGPDELAAPSPGRFPLG